MTERRLATTAGNPGRGEHRCASAGQSRSHESATLSHLSAAVTRGPGDCEERSRSVPEYRYLIVGGGMTADAACRGIRDHDADGSIGLVGEEPHPPYSRPPLSKALWQGKDEATIWRGTAELGVELHLGRRVVSLDLAARQAIDDAGETYATSGSSSRPAAARGSCRATPATRLVYFRTLADYRRLRALADEGASFVVLGGGFIGSEVAAALRWTAARSRWSSPRTGSAPGCFPPTSRSPSTSSTASTASRCVPGELVSRVERGRRHSVSTGERAHARGRRRRRGARHRPRDRARGGAPGSRSPTGSSSTSTAGRADAATSSRRVTSHASRRRCSARDARRARGPGEQPWPRGRREHGRRG